MNFIYKFLMVLTFQATQLVYALESGGLPDSKQSSTASRISCPSADFSAFIRAFSNDISVQKVFTQYPLKWITLVDPTSEPKPEFSTKFLKINEIRFPIFLTDYNIREYGLVLKVKKISQNLSSVIESSAGDKNLGHHVEYKFQKREGCWFLIEIIDEST